MSKLHSMKKTIVIIIAVIILIIAGALAWLYHGPVTQSRESVFSKISFLPGAKVGNHLLSVNSVLDRYTLIRALQPEGQQINKADLEKLVLSKYIDETKLAIIADRNKITVSSDEKNIEYKAVVKQLSGGDEAKFKTDLLDKYKLSPEKFKQDILTSNIIGAKLTVWYNGQSNLNLDLYKKLKEVQDKLSSGTDFAAVAKEFSQDQSTKDLGGDAGFLPQSDLLPEFVTSLNKMKQGETQVIASRYGVHVVKLIGTDSANGETRFHIQQIFLSNTTFDKWLTDQTKSISVKQFIRF